MLCTVASDKDAGMIPHIPHFVERGSAQLDEEPLIESDVSHRNDQTMKRYFQRIPGMNDLTHPWRQLFDEIP